jgi:predicted enzyme related to lactoylglutathione lyase
MINRVSQVAIQVADKERARAFWTEQVGFEVHTDEQYGEERWIEIAPPAGPLLILDLRPGDEAGKPRRSDLPDSPILFACDDIERTHRELAERGVRFPTPPTVMPFGWWAVFEDDLGTRYGLSQTEPARDEQAFLAAEQSKRDLTALQVLVGRWQTRGSTIEGPTGPAAEIDALDTYEWLPGRQALLHRVDARVGEQKVEGAEIIGYDPVQGAYRTQYFGSDGPTAYIATLSEEDAGLVWRMQSADTRFTGTFAESGESIVGHWELFHEDSWRPWMDITLAKGGSSAR